MLSLTTLSQKHGLIKTDPSSRYPEEIEYRRRTSERASAAVRLGSLNPKDEFHKPENFNNPITKSESFNVAELFILGEFQGKQPAETDSLPTDAKQLREDYCLVQCHSSRSNDLSVHARVDTTKKHRLLWESSKEDDKYSHAACFEVKFGENLKKQSPIRATELLILFFFFP